MFFCMKNIFLKVCHTPGRVGTAIAGANGDLNKLNYRIHENAVSSATFCLLVHKENP